MLIGKFEAVTHSLQKTFKSSELFRYFYSSDMILAPLKIGGKKTSHTSDLSSGDFWGRFELPPEAKSLQTFPKWAIIIFQMPFKLYSLKVSFSQIKLSFN